MSDSGGYLGWFGLETAPIRAKFGKHFCLYCGHLLALKQMRCEEKFYDIKKVYRFCCSKCNKVISPITQLSYEDNEKRLGKIYKVLLEYVKPEQLKIVWLDSQNSVLNKMDIDNLDSILLIIIINGIEFKVPFSKVKKLMFHYEHPIKIIKDRRYNKHFVELKEYVKRFGN